MFDDPWVVNTLRYGYRLDLVTDPPLTVAPLEGFYTEADIPVLADAVGKLVEKRAVRELATPEITPGFYSRIFLVPKKDSPELRMIHNLKSFNESYLRTPPKFRMLTLTDLKALIAPADWLASIDLKDAYLHVPIHPDHHKYLRFIFQGRHYEWVALPFGISSAPWLFTRLTSPITGFLHRRGIRYFSYLDDSLVANPLADMLSRQLAFVRRLLEQLGWIVNLPKSELTPSQNLKFIGGLFDTVKHRLYVPPDRWHKIQTMVAQVLSVNQTVHYWERLIGLLVSAQDCTERGRLQLRPLQLFLIRLLAREESCTLVTLPADLRSYLEWWTVPCNVLSGVSMRPFQATRNLYTDASLVGWGAHLEGEVNSGLWSVAESGLHINCLEFKAVINAVSHWRHRLVNARLMLATDNTTVASYVNKLGGTHSRQLLDLTFEFYALVDSIPCHVRARHIPGVRNVLADALSRPRDPSPTEWMLNPVVFQWLCEQFDRPMIDLFATRFNNQLPLFVSPVPDPRAIDHDALALDWTGMDAYAYPPTVLIPLILNKLRGVRCRMLLIAPLWPARTWYPELRDRASQPPLSLPVRRDLLIHPHTRQHHPNAEVLKLHAWMLLPTD